MSTLSLPSIIALARAGALEHAWRLLLQDEIGDDDAPRLLVKGRLLKDRALEKSGKERLSLLERASAAYGQAAALGSATYPLINAATVSLLAGDPQQASKLAQKTLSLLEADPDEPETVYYLHATRAEAFLLLDRHHEAAASFAEAVAIAPSAWEDHASTLRQFALISDAQGRNASWLDAYRPPCSLHFGGHMSFAADGEHAVLKAEIAAVLAAEKIGFGFGALAAGADIIVAEALLEHGAELHAVLPGGTEAFAAVSVDPFGPEWRRRFDAVLGKAVEVRAVRPIGALPDITTIAIADEVAMGAAVMNARRLESRAVQLLVVADSASRRARDVWSEAGWAQHIVCAPREDAPAGSAAAPAKSASRAIALLTVAPADGTNFGAWLQTLSSEIDRLPAPRLGPYASEGHVSLAYGTPLEAAQAAIALRTSLPELRIGGSYSAAETFHDPFSNAERLGGDAAAAAAGALASTLPGTIYITEDFAAALVASGPPAPRSEFIGEMDAPDDGPPVGLHVLKS
jgi:tetratricopeptide (TPR) repeat protein